MSGSSKPKIVGPNVLKRDGSFQPFDKNKLLSSISKAGATNQQASLVADRVIGRLGGFKQTVPSSQISSMVARSLGKLNPTASSQYTSFREQKLRSPLAPTIKGAAFSKIPPVVQSAGLKPAAIQRAPTLVASKSTLSLSATIDAFNLNAPNDWVLQGQTFTLTGVLSPVQQSGIVDLYHTPPVATGGIRASSVPSSQYKQALPPIKVEMSRGMANYQFKSSDCGTHTFIMKWPGDSKTLPCESNQVSVIVLASAPKPTLTLTPSKFSVCSNEQFRLNGTLSEPKSAYVGLFYKQPGASSFIHLKELEVINGSFSYDYQIGVEGEAQFRVDFNSDIVRVGSTTSGNIPVLVGLKIKPTIVLSIDQTLGHGETAFVLSGTLSTPKTSTIWKGFGEAPPHFVPPVQVFVHHRDDPDGYQSGWHRAVFNGLLDAGVFRIKNRPGGLYHAYLLLTHNCRVCSIYEGWAPKGVYEIKVYWPGDETTEAAESNIVTFEIQNEYGIKPEKPKGYITVMVEEFIDMLPSL